MPLPTAVKVVSRIHCIPIGGREPIHAAHVNCWCWPLEMKDGVVPHNASDCRERYERQGITNKDLHWVQVLELRIRDV